MENDELREIVREAVREELRPLETRVINIELGHQQLAALHRNLATEVGRVSKQQADTATVISALNQSANAAVELATRALRAADETKDEARKMITSAMEINKEAVASSVREGLRPLSIDVAKLKESSSSVAKETTSQSKELISQTTMLGEIKSAKRLDRVLIALAGISTFVSWLVAHWH